MAQGKSVPIDTVGTVGSQPVRKPPGSSARPRDASDDPPADSARPGAPPSPTAETRTSVDWVEDHCL